MNRFKSNSKCLTWLFMAFLMTALVAGCGKGDGTGHWNSATTVLVSIAVTPATATIPVGGTKQFTATARYSDGTARDVSLTSTWSATNVVAGTTVATVVLNSGIATGANAGNSNIKATFGGMTGSATLTVNTSTSVKFEVLPTAASTPVGGAQQFAAIETFSDGSTQDRTATSAWTSGTPSIATVSNTVPTKGRANGIAVGTSLITATFGTLPPASATLTVTAATSVKFEVIPSAASAQVGGTQQFTARQTFSDGSTQDRTATSTWTSGTPLVATVSNFIPTKGLATGNAVGTSLITATFGTLPSASGTLTVTAAQVPPAAASCNGPGPVDIGAATSFGVLVGPAGGATLTVTNPTTVTGDTGAASYIPAVGVSTLVGTKYTGTAPPYVAAKAAMLNAITCASGRPCDFSYTGVKDFGGSLLQPGVHCVSGAMAVGTPLTLNNPGVYIFRSTGALTSAPNITVAYGGSANAGNTSIFWVPTGLVTIAADNAFLGTIMPDSSAAITLGANTTLLGGRVLSNSDVTLDKNVIAIP